MDNFRNKGDELFYIEFIGGEGARLHLLIRESTAGGRGRFGVSLRFVGAAYLSF
jgi:hypothetical protein